MRCTSDELLVVLLAEEREVGPGEREQLVHHGEHAVEVARAARRPRAACRAGPGSTVTTGSPSR